MMGDVWRKTDWLFCGCEGEREAFGSFAALQNTAGEEVSRDQMSSVRKLKRGNDIYYIKEYTRNGKGPRHYLGRGRLRGEWENLLYFDQLKIPIPRVVAYGQRYQFGIFRQGFLVTAEVAEAQDLKTLFRNQPQLFRRGPWLTSVTRQVADYTRRLHRDGFVHWDLKWRNVLVAMIDLEQPQVYFFDCPLGRQWFGWLRNRGIIKDLACLDKVASQAMSRSRRLAFFLHYQERTRLSAADKKMIGQILSFFSSERADELRAEAVD